MAVVLISGGTGLIGAKLTSHLTDSHHEVIILTRNRNKKSPNSNVSFSFWDVKNKIIDTAAVVRADHIVHLAGAGVMDKKWTKEYKRQIMESRTKSASLLIEILRTSPHHVKTFVSASAIGWYGPDANPLIRQEGFLETDPAGSDFSAEVCMQWENTPDEVKQLGIRLVKLRTGIVLSNDGGEFKEIVAPLKFGIAGIFGDGSQIVSWIHIDDVCRMYMEAINNKDLRGVYNAVAPLPVSNKRLMMVTAEKMRNKFFIPIHVPKFFLKLLLGKRSIEILKSATVSCKKIKALGFTFLYPTIESAVGDLAK
jgi:uncharacterized protein